MRVNFNTGSRVRRTGSNLNFSGIKSIPVNVAQLINENRVVDTFIKLAKIDSGSNEELAETRTPSTDGQKDVAKFLKKELEQIGLKDIELDKHSILTATLESNIGESPVIGFLAHMDTSPDAPSNGVKPQIQNYEGGDIVLKEGATIPANQLEAYIGQKIITSDGTTLLGADDKAGIAEILEALKIFKEHPELKHPKLRIAFTPDEETGMGTEHFDIKKFGADFAYTVDGDLPEVIENESFNAFNPVVTIHGKNTHLGYAKASGQIDSIEAATWFMTKLPLSQKPRNTEGKQGYYFVEKIVGDPSLTIMNMVVRDHNYQKELKRIEYLKSLLKQTEEKYHCKAEIDPKPRYRNMGDKIKEFPELLKYTKEGILRSGLIPKLKAIRGGTDGSDLSLKGLLTPNLGAGGQNFHSKCEFLPIRDMNKCCENIVNIVMVWAEKSKKVMPKILARRM